MNLKARIQGLVTDFQESSLLQKGRNFLQSIELKRTGTNLYLLIKTFIKESQRVDVDTNASAVAYRFLLALPPLMLFFFTLLPHLPLQGYTENIYYILNIIFPEDNEANIIYEFISDFINTPRNGLLSISLILAFYISSNGINKMLQIFDKYLRVNVKEITVFKRRLKAIQLLILFLLLYISMLTLVIGQHQLIQWIVEYMDWNEKVSANFLLFMTYLILIAVLMISIALLYYFGPSVNQRWKFFSTGVYIASAGILLFTLALSFIASSIVDYNQVYGSVGTLFLFIIWLYTNSKIILSGFLVNMSLDHFRYTYLDEDEEYY